MFSHQDSIHFEDEQVSSLTVWLIATQKPTKNIVNWCNFKIFGRTPLSNTSLLHGNMEKRRFTRTVGCYMSRVVLNVSVQPFYHRKAGEMGRFCPRFLSNFTPRKSIVQPPPQKSLAACCKNKDLKKSTGKNKDLRK